MAILQVKELTKTYGKGDTTVKALDGVNLSVNKGEFVAIIGSSGSGKSTLMHLIGGVDRPNSGSVIVDGNAIFTQNESELAVFRRRNIGIIYQFYNLIPTLTAEENIMLPRLLDNRKPDNDKLKSILETIGLTKRAKHLPSELSGGQQQRVAIARALALKPDVLCFDEPTSALDPELTGEVLKVIRSLAENNTTMIIVTHEMQFARQVADTILFLDEGNVIEHGKSEILDNPSSDRLKRFLERFSQTK